MGPFNTIEDFSLWDRCVTRGLAGSWLPVVYGNGTRIIQTPDSVIIAHEMVHETRVIPLDGRPHVGSGLRQLMGDSRGHWEGNTLVIETTNFTDRLAVTGGVRRSEAMKMTERIARIDPQMIDFELRVDDPKTYVAPWTLRMTLTSQSGYEMYEYELPRREPLRTERAERRARLREAGRGKRREGAAAPRRVFEKVNGEELAAGSARSSVALGCDGILQRCGHRPAETDQHHLLQPVVGVEKRRHGADRDRGPQL